MMTFELFESMTALLERDMNKLRVYVETTTIRLNDKYRQYQASSPSDEMAHKFRDEFIVFSRCYLKMFCSLIYGALIDKNEIQDHKSSKWLIDRDDYEALAYLYESVDSLFPSDMKSGSSESEFSCVQLKSMAFSKRCWYFMREVIKVDHNMEGDDVGDVYQRCLAEMVSIINIILIEFLNWNELIFPLG